MARDYKPRTKSKRKTTSQQRGSKGGRRSSGRRTTSTDARSTPGWQWLLTGLAIGLLVAAGVFFYDRDPEVAARLQARSGGESDSGAGRQTVVKPPQAGTGDTAATPAADAPREYAFYDLLPRFEVVITEEETAVGGSNAAVPTAVRDPGSYVLQAGSFRNHADADRMQATLALQGIESRISIVTIDGNQTWHRVRIGPIDDLDGLERVREQLRGAGVEFIVIRVGENG